LLEVEVIIKKSEKMTYHKIFHFQTNFSCKWKFFGLQSKA